MRLIHNDHECDDLETDPRRCEAFDHIRRLSSKYTTEFVEQLCADLSDPPADALPHLLRQPLRLVGDNRPA